MKVAIHQPNFLPWLGYFYKMAKSDVFVILDNVQYEKNGLTNRTKIKTTQGERWLTLPVSQKFPRMIKKIELVNFENEKKKILKTIELNYKKAKYFDYLFPELKKILEKEWRYLADLNIELIKLLEEKLKIKTKLEIASSYDFQGESDDLLISICKKFNAESYLSGRGGSKYQDENKFKKANIKLEYTDFICLPYPQLWGDFIPGLSIIDLLFNCGPKSDEILLSNKMT